MICIVLKGVKVTLTETGLTIAWSHGDYDLHDINVC